MKYEFILQSSIFKWISISETPEAITSGSKSKSFYGLNKKNIARIYDINCAL